MSQLLLGPFDLLSMASPVKLTSAFERGAPVPNVTEVVSTVLDGSLVTGSAASNREMTVPLLVTGTSRLNVAATANQVLLLANSASFTLTFIPDNGVAVVWDCFRATMTPTSPLSEDAQLKQEFSLAFEALPYGRSTTPQSFTLAGTIVVVDDFPTVPTVTPSAWSATASDVTFPTYHGGNALQLVAPSSTYGTTVSNVTVSRSGLSVSLASTTAAMSFEFYQTGLGMGPGGTPWTLSVTVGGTVYTATSTQIPGYEVWTPITFTFASPVPAGTLTAYTISYMSFYQRAVADDYIIDYLIAYPAAGVRASSTNGTEFMLPFVAGSARAPANLTLTAPTGTFTQFAVHSPPSDTPDTTCLIPVQTTGSTASVGTPAGARYNGTYSVYLGIGKQASLGAGTNITCAISQTGATTVSLVHTVTAAETTVINAGPALLYMGETVLPLAAAPSAAAPTITFALSNSASLPILWEDLLLLDTRGQTILTDIGTPAALNVYVNEPIVGTSFGAIYSSTGTLSAALSISSHLVTGSSLFLYPPGGSARLLVWAIPAAPTAALSYTPRWIQEATV